MNDRELLELAAKAAGIDGEYAEKMRMVREFCFETHIYIKMNVGEWNPRAIADEIKERLAVRLNLAVVLHPALNQALVRPYHTRDMDRECREDCEKHTDHFAATRHAIVRAAAEIGRQMQEGGAA